MRRTGPSRMVAAALLAAILGTGMIPARAQEPAKDAAKDKAASPPAATENKGLATRALEAAKSAAREAGDILTRVPCLPAHGVNGAPGSLPRIAHRLAAGEPVTIVAFGSSTTVGYGTTSPAYTYPNRLAEQLRRTYPTADITIVNRGMGGQDTPEMMQRFKTAVLDVDPDLVIWQLGTNTVVKGGDIPATAALVEDGIGQLQSRGIDVVLIDPQYVPAVAAHAENASAMVKLLGNVAQVMNVPLFPRFEVMRQWHQDEKLPFDSFVIADGLHMNDWGYACFAQLLGDTIIRSVGEVKVGSGVPSNVTRTRPM